MSTVNINGHPVSSEIIEVMFKEVQSRKFSYIEKAKSGRNEGIRESSLKKVRLLDDYMNILSYVTGVPFSIPRKSGVR